MAGLQNDSGVSVIVGTLLLILITVTAAAGLAIMVSQMQKDEMNRQSHLAAVKSEKIEILNIGLTNNQTEWNRTPWNIPYSTNWSSMTLTLVNLNTDDVKVIGIAINDHYITNYSTKNDPSFLDSELINISNPYLSIPGTKSKKVQINFLDELPHNTRVQTDSKIQVRIMTSIYNTFEKTFKPPNPVIQMMIESEDLGTIQRDALILDGSQSTADSTILSWNWTIYDLNFTTPYPGNLDDYGNWVLHNQTFHGKTVRTSELNNTPYYRVSLTVTDALGMSATSQSPLSIPPGQFSPPTYLNLRLDKIGDTAPNVTTSYINATIKDINNQLLKNAPVTFIIKNDPNANTRCFSLNPTAVYTDDTGNATVIASQEWKTESCNAVTVFGQYGKLISQEIIVPKVDIH
jgi:flagellin-like protein